MGLRASLPVLLALIAGCAATGGQPKLPYPAFVSTDDLATTFLATLPGVRVTQYRSDMHTGAAAHRIDIPPDWTGSTGGAPGKALEVYVLAGEVRFSEFPLRAGGYAYVPPGSIGFRLESDNGAQILYFLDDVPESSRASSRRGAKCRRACTSRSCGRTRAAVPKPGCSASSLVYRCRGNRRRRRARATW